MRRLAGSVRHRRRQGAIRVMLADDDPDLRLLLATAFALDERLELVATAVDGRDALTLLRKHRPDVAVLDIAMPRMTGIEVAQAIRERELGVRVVFHTGLAEPAVVAIAAALGADLLVKGVVGPREVANAAVAAAARGFRIQAAAAS